MNFILFLNIYFSLQDVFYYITDISITYRIKRIEMSFNLATDNF